MKFGELIITIAWIAEWVLTLAFSVFKILGFFDVPWLIVFAPVYALPVCLLVFQFCKAMIDIGKELKQ